MKKIITILIAALVGFTSAAQTSQNYAVTSLRSATFNQPFDTVTNTTAHYMVSGPIKGYFSTINVVLKATEISGTTNGTATLETSLDGVSWYPYYNAHDTSYSCTLLDQTGEQTFRWALHDWGDVYVRIKVVGIGTPNVKIAGQVHAKK